jgi:hypothetical protein
MEDNRSELLRRWRQFRVALFAALIGWAVGVLSLLALVRWAGLESDNEWEIPGLALFMGACVMIYPLVFYPWGHRHAEVDQERPLG